MSEPETRIRHIQDLLKDPKMDTLTLDQAVWAYFRKVDWPLTHYDEETFWECRSEGDPQARGVSDASGFLRCLEDRHPGVRLKFETGGQKAQVDILITGYGIGVGGKYQGPFSYSGLGRAFAHAGLDADQKACALEMRLLEVSGVTEVAPPIAEWPIEELQPGKFCPVHHDLRLASQFGSTAERARENANLNHKGDYGIMLCRERYEQVMRERDHDKDDPSP